MVFTAGAKLEFLPCIEGDQEHYSRLLNSVHGQRGYVRSIHLNVNILAGPWVKYAHRNTSVSMYKLSSM